MHLAAILGKYVVYVVLPDGFGDDFGLLVADVHHPVVNTQ